MKPAVKNSENRGERGIALLIAIFALLLISGIAVALIMMAGTESAIEGNYRGSTQAFYDSYAGLEEGRGRSLRAEPLGGRGGEPHQPHGCQPLSGH